jgi:hypothetical protein
MVKFIPTPLEGLSVDEAIRVSIEEGRELHKCVDGLRAEMVAGFKEAREKRSVLTNGQKSIQQEIKTLGRRVTDVEGTVSVVTSAVGGLKAGQVVASGATDALAKMFGAIPYEDGEKRLRPSPMREQWWKHPFTSFAGLCVTIGGLVIALGTVVDRPHTLATLVAIIHAAVTASH